MNEEKYPVVIFRPVVVQSVRYFRRIRRTAALEARRICQRFYPWRCNQSVTSNTKQSE